MQPVETIPIIRRNKRNRFHGKEEKGDDTDPFLIEWAGQVVIMSDYSERIEGGSREMGLLLSNP